MRFPLGKKYEDTFLLYKVIARCSQISHVEQTLYYYVRRPGSTTTEAFNIKNFDYGEALIEIYHFAKRNRLGSLKDYCAMRLSYKFEDWYGQISKHPDYMARYREIKRQSFFLLYEKNAWKDYNVKGKMYSRIRFLGSGLL